MILEERSDSKKREDRLASAEVAGDFPNKSLPTLDFSMKMKDNMKITHQYYEKEMKSQLVIERDSAMGNKQKFCILGNELTRRLLNIDAEMDQDELEEEVTNTIEHFTKQVKPMLENPCCIPKCILQYFPIFSLIYQNHLCFPYYSPTCSSYAYII